MRTKKIKMAMKVYGVIGKSLCACAGGIVGLVVGGPFLAILGIFLGGLGGHLLEKATLFNMR